MPIRDGDRMMVVLDRWIVSVDEDEPTGTVLRFDARHEGGPDRPDQSEIALAWATIFPDRDSPVTVSEAGGTARPLPDDDPYDDSYYGTYDDPYGDDPVSEDESIGGWVDVFLAAGNEPSSVRRALIEAIAAALNGGEVDENLLLIYGGEAWGISREFDALVVKANGKDKLGAAGGRVWADPNDDIVAAACFEAGFRTVAARWDGWCEYGRGDSGRA